MPDDIQMPNPSNGSGDSSTAKKSAIKVGPVAVSTSLALIATSAIAHAASYEAVEVSTDTGVSDELDRAIASAVSKRSVREAVSESLDIFTSNLTFDGKSIADEYFDGKSIGEWQVAQNESGVGGQVTGGGDAVLGGGGGATGGLLSQSGTINSFSCYSNCHSACHGACHGSRGWR
ncbi:MAG: hypothetical protein KI792_10265 [Alphaproteobacteria bacterium]|nr:hypothetical protein [Alphaproteobacteria bacterium SS10]